MECELVVMSYHDTIIIRRTLLNRYYFNFSPTKGCIVMGNGSLLNHSPDSNVGYVLVERRDRKLMHFYTKRDIRANEELLINYDDDGPDAHEDIRVRARDIIPVYSNM
jgi:hypothetical protein